MPKKLERCVREVKRRSGVKNAWAVCTAALRKKNPQGLYEILTRKGRGPLMAYDGRKFTNNGSPKTYSYPVALKKARELLNRFEILRSKGYRVWLSKMPGRARRANPENLDEAAHKLEEFTGHEATKIIETQQPQVKKGLVIGELDLIGYRVKREGVNAGRMVSYGHRFRKKSRPLLAVSQDGKHLLIVGGRYEFTEAGIEDR